MQLIFMPAPTTNRVHTWEQRGSTARESRAKKLAISMLGRWSMVRSEGLEPPRFYSLPPQGSASTNSATSAWEDRPGTERPGRINGVDVTNQCWRDKACRSPEDSLRDLFQDEFPTQIRPAYD